MRSRSEQAERSQEEYRAESAFNKSSPQCQLQRNLPVMLHPRIVKQHICINAFHAGMVVRIGEPGIEKWREGVADPEPVAQRPGSDHDEGGQDEAEELAPAGETTPGEADPGEGKGQREEGGIFCAVSSTG